MNHSNSLSRVTRRTRPTTVAALAVVAAVLIGLLAYPSLTSSSVAMPAGTAPAGQHPPRGGEGGGRVADGVTVLDDVPAVTKLDPDLLRAIRAAAKDASDDGIPFVVNSGWRSRDYQRQLLRDAVSTYGSEAEAARWVATPGTSPHVSGEAVDIGPVDAMSWLSQHGASHGLCQIYGNEPWHYELRPAAVDDGCPQMYADPTHDPRMRR